MIQHSVIFKLKLSKGSAAEAEFLTAAKALSSIPGVQHFKSFRQVSSKNPFDYGLTMEFSDQETYDGYSNHPDHTLFLEQYWVKDVEDYLEIDFEQL